MSKQSGSIVHHITTPDTIADGLRTSLGEHTWPVVRDLVDDIETVTEDEIKSAYKLILERMKCMIEPSAAVGVAVALKQNFKSKFPKLQHVGIILCGGMYILFSFYCVARLIHSSFLGNRQRRFGKFGIANNLACVVFFARSFH